MGNILINATEVKNRGGWVLDTQFVLTMGTPYLLAHGLGTPVDDAKTTFCVSAPGIYTAYAYTFNWVAPWKPQYAPGIFELHIDGEKIGDVYGNSGARWSWQKGGRVFLEEGSHELLLHDLTGFEGRVGMIFLTDEENPVLPEKPEEVRQFIYSCMGSKEPSDEGEYDLVVCGGGITGICASLSAARNGVKVALVQDRPVVGGNNSSEVRVWLGGETHFEPFPGIGNITNEIEQAIATQHSSDNKPENYEDEKKLGLLCAEKNITLYLENSVTDVVTENGVIKGVISWDFKNGKRRIIRGRLFADCTGDATIGALAGADFEVTTNGHMGMTCMWYLEDTGKEETFPECPWAIDLSNADFPGRLNAERNNEKNEEGKLGCWYWECGMEHDPIAKMEYARDLCFRAMFGAVDAMKNKDGTYKNYKPGFCAYIAGKRESRRLFGDIIMTKSDVLKGVEYPDSCVPSTWNFDVHYPDRKYYAAFHEGDAFIAKDYHEPFKKPYFIPYRSLYSRNISNLFMAGRNISVSHDALGTARVMRTCGMMGEVVGYAAKYCIRYSCDPREVYSGHIEEFINELKSIPAKKENRLVANMP